MATNERSRFAGVIGAIIVLATLGLLIAQTLENLVARWLKFDESYSHGLLLLAVTSFILLRKCRAQPPTPGLYPIWLVPFALALSGYVIGGVLRVEALQHLLLIPLLLGALAVLLGWRQVKPLILPVGILIFAMPFWDYLSWPLQLITVEVNELGLGLLGIDFAIDGVFVYLTGVGAFEVAHGCSGLRYLLVGQSLALLYGELNLRAIRSRVYLYLAAVFLSLFANWMRVLIIIYMGHETNMQTSLIEDHDNFGWWVFAVTLVPLFLFGRRLEESEVEQRSGSGRTANDQKHRPQLRWYFGPLLIAVLSLASWLILPEHTRAQLEAADAYPLRLDDERYGSAFSPDLENWRPQIRNADRIYQQTLFDKKEAAGNQAAMPTVYYVSIHSYDFQRQGAEVIQYFNRNYDSEKWRPRDLFAIEGPGHRKFSGVSLEHYQNRQKVHVAHGYYVEGFWESDQLRAKLSQLAGLFNTRTDASQITFAVACDDCHPQKALRSLINAQLPTLINAIDSQYQP